MCLIAGLMTPPSSMMICMKKKKTDLIIKTSYPVAVMAVSCLLAELNVTALLFVFQPLQLSVGCRGFRAVLNVSLH